MQGLPQRICLLCQRTEEVPLKGLEGSEALPGVQKEKEKDIYRNDELQKASCS